MLCEAFLFAKIKLLASVNNVTFASQFNKYAAYDFKPNANAILSRMYEHLFKSVVLKCLLFTATSSNFPSFSLNKQADAATLLASVYITKLSVGSGIVNHRFIVEIALSICHDSSSTCPHVNSPLRNKTCNG